MKNLLLHYKTFNRIASENDIKSTVKMYLHSLLLRILYGIGSRDYLNNRLFDNSISHEDFYNSFHRYLHQWNVVSRKFAPQWSSGKLLCLKVDYLISKFIYPGLDAMDYFRYEFYKIKHIERKTFITEGELRKMDRFFNGREEQKELNAKLSNKCDFNRMFEDIVKRKWITTENCTIDGFIEFCNKTKRVIVKPLDEGGGKGIFVPEVDTYEKIQSLYNFIGEKKYIVEEILTQHPMIANLNPTSVNTIRVYSICCNGKVSITGATLRVGVGESPTDNYSKGGLAAEIDIETGLVISRAVSQNADSVYIHPNSNIAIIGFQIPCWNDILTTVKKAHLRVKELGYIGWDVVVCNDSKITFIEANTGAGVGIQQHPALKGKRYIYESFVNTK